MDRASRYSLWARHIKKPRVNEGETVFDAVSRIAHGFVGKKVWQATVVRHFGNVVALEDKPVTLTGIAKIDMIGAEVKNGSTETLYPNVTFVGDTEKWAGVYFRADTIYETQLLIGKDSEVMCGGYGKALNEALMLVRNNKILIEHLIEYRGDRAGVRGARLGKGVGGQEARRPCRSPHADCGRRGAEKGDRTMTYQQAHNILAEHQKWRRGIGQYECQPEPEKNLPMPYGPKELGEAMDRAIDALAEMAERKGADA